jgi:hypothetical protein
MGALWLAHNATFGPVETALYRSAGREPHYRSARRSLITTASAKSDKIRRRGALVCQGRPALASFLHLAQGLKSPHPCSVR